MHLESYNIELDLMIRLPQVFGQNLSMDFVSRRGGLGGLISDRTSLAY